jgi:hypothetical protein
MKSSWSRTLGSFSPRGARTVPLASTWAFRPKTLTSGLQRHGVPHGIAHQISTLPPVSSLFAALLGVNPVQHLLAPSGALSPARSLRHAGGILLPDGRRADQAWLAGTRSRTAQ